MAFLGIELVIFLFLDLVHSMQLYYSCAQSGGANLVRLRPGISRVRMRSLFRHRIRRCVPIERRLKIVNRSDRARGPLCLIQLVVPLHPY
jgi:hypothetical protein